MYQTDLPKWLDRDSNKPRFRLAENVCNVGSLPWKDAIGIEDVLDPDDLAIPALVLWITRGNEPGFAQFVVDALNAKCVGQENSNG